MRKVEKPNNVLLPEVAKMLKEGKQVTIGVKGCSMLPFIVGHRDRVVLQRENHYICGDIVLAQIEEGVFVLHRIIKIDDQQITLMGDGNLQGVEKCSLESIAGRVIKIITNKKEIDPNLKQQRLKAMLWLNLLSVRRYLLAIYRRAWNLKKDLK